MVTTTLKAIAQHLDNNVITAADLDTTQLCAKNQGLPNITTALADLHQEDLVADTTADQRPGTTAGHPIEAGPTGVPAEVLIAGSTGHPSAITGKGEALHHTSTRLVTLHTSFQDHVQQKDN